MTGTSGFDFMGGGVGVGIGVEKMGGCAWETECWELGVGVE